MMELGGRSSTQDKYEALCRAVKKHKEQMIQCLQGQGITRHLLGLRITAMMRGETMPSFFSDVAYRRSTGYTLSTSNVSGFLGGFSPFNDQGTGVCYGINKSHINFSICCSTKGPRPVKSMWRRGRRTETETTIKEGRGGGGGGGNGNTDSTAAVFREELVEALLEMQEVCSAAYHSDSEEIKARM